jgi:hypothetical protein
LEHNLDVKIHPKVRTEIISKVTIKLLTSIIITLAHGEAQGLCVFYQDIL